MEENKTGPRKFNGADIDLEAVKSKPETAMSMVSPTSSLAQPNSAKPSSSSSSTKVNCLCSPTTHLGSFRCRIHRTGSGILRGHSVGANLSEYGSSKPTTSDDDSFQ